MPHQRFSYCTWRFNATDFLVRLKGKRLMLVGDSMNRNQFESILCVLREGLQNKSRMYEIHGHKITKGRGYFVFKFVVKVYLACLVSSNFYALIVWSVFILLFSLKIFLSNKMNSTIWEVKTSQLPIKYSIIIWNCIQMIRQRDFFIFVSRKCAYGQTAECCAKILKYLDRTIIARCYLWDLISLWRKECVLVDTAQILHCQ